MRLMKTLMTGVALAVGLTGAVFAQEKLKVGFIYIGPVGDLGWTYQHDLGRKAIDAALGDKVETSYVESVPEGADAERVLTQMALSGTKLIFTLHHGTRLEGEGDTLRTISFARYQIAENAEAMGLLKLPSWRNRAFEMGVGELRQAIADTPGRPDLVAELHRRFILPSTILLLAIFALPLSIQPKRSGKAAPYMLGIALVLLLYNTQIILHQQVLNGRVGPWAMWLGQGLFLALGCWLFQRISSGKAPTVITTLEQRLGALQRRAAERLRQR